MSIRKRFKPIEIHADEPSDIFENNRRELAKAIVEGVAYGLRTKKNRVDFAKVLIKEVIVITLSIDSREFTDLLDEQLQILIDFEEYETCALVVKLKNKLEHNQMNFPLFRLIVRFFSSHFCWYLFYIYLSI